MAPSDEAMFARIEARRARARAAAAETLADRIGAEAVAAFYEGAAANASARARIQRARLLLAS
jgi:hypothetical protein